MAEMQEAQAQLADVKPFLAKTYEILENPDNKNLISWTATGATFIVKDSKEFARDLLPKYFKHNNFASFVRQLNIYGFRKVCTDFHEYQHDLFRRGEKHRLVEIRQRPGETKKKKSSPEMAATSSNMAISSISPPRDAAASNADADIVRQNKRLRKENEALKQELDRLRSMCRHVAAFMKDFAGGEPVSAVSAESSGGAAAEE